MSDSSDTANPHESGINRIAGSREVEVKCPTADAEPELCDGWSATVELDEPAFINEDERLRLPGFEWECPTCGNPHEFIIDGVRVSNLV